MKRIPIGVSDFEELRKGEYYFVDKSMLIADVMRGVAEVLQFTRPRRFGKTLNLSMLHAFFDMNGQNTDLFQDLEVGQHEDVMAHCGGYPTIFLSFKDLKFDTYNQCYGALTGILSKLFKKHKPVLEAAGLEDIDKTWVEEILRGKAEPYVFQNSLALLSELLHKATGKKAVILIDEYDMPIHSGFHNGYYEDIIGFMRNLLSGAYKDNKHLEKGVLTGIMRIAKESFSPGSTTHRSGPSWMRIFLNISGSPKRRWIRSLRTPARRAERRRWRHGTTATSSGNAPCTTPGPSCSS